jgi:hypothetical protein
MALVGLLLLVHLLLVLQRGQMAALKPCKL